MRNRVDRPELTNGVLSVDGQETRASAPHVRLIRQEHVVVRAPQSDDTHAGDPILDRLRLAVTVVMLASAALARWIPALGVVQTSLLSVLKHE
jgi:hypothetical protein